MCEAAHTLHFTQLTKPPREADITHLGSPQKKLRPRGWKGLLQARGDSGTGARRWPPHFRGEQGRREEGLPGEVPLGRSAALRPWSLPRHLPVSAQSSPFRGQPCWPVLASLPASRLSEPVISQNTLNVFTTQRQPSHHPCRAGVSPNPKAGQASGANCRSWCRPAQPVSKPRMVQERMKSGQDNR